MKLKNLRTSKLGSEVLYFDAIDSTQSEIWRRIEDGTIRNGMTIIARNQTAGMGTNGRRWYTNQNSILFSCYLELNCKISWLDGMTKKIAEILIQIMKDMYQVNLALKEPNDLFYNGKKVGGILTQTRISNEIVKYIVIGIGINTNTSQLHPEIEAIATSIQKEFGVVIDNEEVIAEFCNRLEEELNQYVDFN